MPKHVLVVDDHAPWRGQIRELLHLTGAWQVSGEASDGGEAIAKAEALRPDVILLDIELPSMNGIEAAKGILSSDPGARILFVSAHRSWDIVDAALATGARGYLLKTFVADELLAAMETVVAGGRFISPVLTGRSVDRTTLTSSAPCSRFHEAGFYTEDTFLLDEYARFAGGALVAGSAVLLVAIESRRQAVYQRLETRGVDVELAISQKRLLPMDVAETLATFMVDGWPDEARFWEGGHSLITDAWRASAGQHPRVAACGECAASLVRDGRADAAVRLEQLWDDFARTYNVDIFCGYSAQVARDDAAGAFARICATHSAVHSR